MIFVKIIFSLFLVKIGSSTFAPLGAQGVTMSVRLPDLEKLKFVRKQVSWFEGKDIMDTCFILNFGYEALLPWPQV